MALKDWKKNRDKNRFEKDGKIVQVGSITIGQGTKVERKQFWLVHGANVTHSIKTQAKAIKIARAYMRSH